MTEIAQESPRALHLPAILQNPTNPSLRQVAAHNAQQREKVIARREHSKPVNDAYSGRGKRYVRRKDNASFAFNPHIAQPTRSDFSPPVPLHHQRVQPNFPPSSLPRSASIPDAERPPRDPFSSDSRSGAFSTSLKGTRAMLRKRGRRAELLVDIVEGKIRDWLSGDRSVSLAQRAEGETWSIMDSTLVDCSGTASSSLSGSPPSATASTSRRMPVQHQILGSIPPLPVQNAQIPAVLELSRSPAHMTWAVHDGFDRLVLHLVVRYYELISWSEYHTTIDNRRVRLTHIVLPTLTQPKIPTSHQALFTPETSDLSAPSSSDRDTDIDRYSEAETASEAGTEVGYSLDPDISQQTITADIALAMNDLDLQRTHSNTSSMYASSEGGSDFGMGDSLTLPPPPDAGGGWTMVMSDTETNSDIGDVELRAPPVVARPGLASLGRMGARGWEEKPTFFEYLYGE